MSESKTLDERIVTAIEFSMRMVRDEISLRKPPGRRQTPTAVSHLQLALAELSDALINQHGHIKNAAGNKRIGTVESTDGQNLKIFEDSVEAAASELNMRSVQSSLQTRTADKIEAIEYGLILARVNNSRINLLNHMQKSAGTDSQLTS